MHIAYILLNWTSSAVLGGLTGFYMSEKGTTKWLLFLALLSNAAQIFLDGW